MTKLQCDFMGSAPGFKEASMLRLALILHLFIGSTLVGIAVIVALVIGLDTLRPILAAAALGFVVAVPVSWGVARKLYM